MLVLPVAPEYLKLAAPGSCNSR